MDIAKLIEEEDHLVNLGKVLSRLRKYQLNLNLSTSEKLLSFIVSRREIKIEPFKVNAIHDMPVPNTKMEVRNFSKA